jgi:hypothetical protein
MTLIPYFLVAAYSLKLALGRRGVYALAVGAISI